ncbi:hypothetical protein [Leucobacter komagatae]|nr:hypothetical protein [Leucobacter komagatae]
MSSIPEIRTLLQQTLEEFDLPTNTVSASTRRALRIASLRRDLVNQLWLHWELTDMTASKLANHADPGGLQIRAQIDTLLGAEEGSRRSEDAFTRWSLNRSVEADGKTGLYSASVGQIEQNDLLVRKTYDNLEVPDNLTQIDTYFVAQTMDASRAKVLPLIQQNGILLERIKSSVHAFLVATEAELDAGQHDSSLFVRAQDYVNSALAKIAPDALEKFVAAQDRLYSGKPEDLAHALTSCRRMIKALADAVYPATGETLTDDAGIGRVMSDDLYRNRLIQYVKETIGKHGQGKVMQDALAALGNRLKSLDSLASKGVHDKVTAAEAETCIVWTYLLAADIVRLADGTSALLVETNDATA